MRSLQRQPQIRPRHPRRAIKVQPLEPHVQPDGALAPRDGRDGHIEKMRGRVQRLRGLRQGRRR